MQIFAQYLQYRQIAEDGVLVGLEVLGGDPARDHSSVGKGRHNAAAGGEACVESHHRARQ